MGKFVQFVVLLVCSFIGSSLQSKAQQTLIKNLLDGNYDKRVRPENKENASGPVFVAVNIYLRSVSQLDPVNNEFDVQLTYRQKWKDERLSFRSSASGDVQYINLINPESFIWRPDTFFTNAKEGSYHNLMVRNEFARLSPNGEVLHSARVSLKLSCPMNFKYFPMDKQTCPIRFASYGYTTSDLRYTWEKDTPVQIPNDIIISTHGLVGFTTEQCDSITKTGSYSCLKANFTFRRYFKPYLINVYIPTTMFFIISCLSFWIDAKEITARMMLLVVTLVVLASQTAELNKTFPPSARTRAVDMWTGIILTFVFGALVEYIIVQYIMRDSERNLSRNGSRNDVVPDAEEDSIKRGADEEQEIPLKDVSASNDGNEDNKEQQQELGAPAKIKQRAMDTYQQYVSKFNTLSEQIDGVSRVAFPAAFILFNILYWPVYCLSS